MKQSITQNLVCFFSWLFLIGSSVVLQAQFTTIPDTAFEQLLIQSGIDTDGIVNGQTATSDLAVVTHLDLDFSASSLHPIYDLTGIEECILLRKLSSTYHPITTLNLSANTALDSLYLYNVNLQNLDLSSLTNLSYFYSEEGRIDSLLLPTGTNNLKELYITDLTLSQLDVTQNILLEKLVLTDNSLSQLDVTQNTVLEHLEIKNNPLVQIDLSQNSNLKKLFLLQNSISQLDLTAHQLLEHLLVSSTLVTQLDLSNKPNLKFLEVESSLLTSLNLLNSNVEYLGVNYNSLLQTLELTNATQLLQLQALHNPNLDSLDISTCSSLVHLFAQGSPLQYLSLNDSSLSILNLSNITLPELDLSKNINLHGLSIMNSQLRELDLTNCPKINTVGITASPYFQFLRLANDTLWHLDIHDISAGVQVCILQTGSINFNPILAYNHSLIVSNDCYSNKIQGYVTLDSNYNCLVDRGEKGLLHRQIEFNKIGSIPIVASTNSDGKYSAYLDTGTYTARVIHPNAYQQTCLPTQTIVIDTFQLTDTLNWSVQDTLSCASLWVDISAPLLRTPTSSYYTVNYCNNGTITADSVQVAVELDPFLTYQSSTIPLASQTGQTLQFTVGTVGVEECQSFTIQVQLDTSVFMGQTHCTQAHIYPDTSCLPIWDGAFLEVEGICLGDSIAFTILNKAAAMSQARTYFVFEDNIMMRQGTVQLGAGASQVIHQVVTAGKTYRLSVEQEVGFPAFLGNALATAALEGCKPLPNGSFNTGFITQFSTGSSAPFLAIDCQQNVGSYDPNDKAAQPVGYDPLYHYIEKTTALDYKIRFQNTGTDTAFNVYILDTISPFLDLTTLQMGASSHQYTWTIQNGNVLRVNFANIMLPDSNVNEPLSNGFFKYKIEQQPNNPLGSIINNQAAIYFDYNPAILTNTTFHTVGENFITAQVISTQVLDKKIEVKIYPNPFTYSTTLEITNKSYEELEVLLYDAAGRVVDRIVGQGDAVQINGNQLLKGVYFYQLRGDGQRIATGKVVVQ